MSTTASKYTRTDPMKRKLRHSRTPRNKPNLLPRFVITGHVTAGVNIVSLKLELNEEQNLPFFIISCIQMFVNPPSTGLINRLNTYLFD